MKKNILFLVIVIFILSCNKKEEPEPIIFTDAIVILKYDMNEFFDRYGQGKIHYTIDRKNGSCTAECRDGIAIKVYPICNRIYYKIWFEWLDSIKFKTRNIGEVKEGSMEITDSVMTLICNDDFFNTDSCLGFGILRFTYKDMPVEYQYNKNTGKYIYWDFVHDTVTFEQVTTFYSVDPRFCAPTKDEEREWRFLLLNASEDCYFIIGHSYNPGSCVPDEILYVEKVETAPCKVTEFTYFR